MLGKINIQHIYDMDIDIASLKVFMFHTSTVWSSIMKLKSMVLYMNFYVCNHRQRHWNQEVASTFNVKIKTISTPIKNVNKTYYPFKNV